MRAEVIVVDNYSADGSVKMLTEKFPRVSVIANQVNFGFAKANNQGIRQSSGKYILLLNPDTVVQEDTLIKCFGYMEDHPDIGSLGVKMIDGKGRYLPESKRALPTPMVAFYKIFGLAALFPRSRRFGKYHLGYLNPDQIHNVDVLSGAFMFIRKETLEKSGLLDEDYFMYGEDIDLSYRITLSGYRNVYYPYTTIIHYKGESTRKSSLNYVILFYKAMIIFARKHFSRKSARRYALFIHLAIYLRAGISILRRFLLTIINPLLDAVFMYAGYWFFLPVWESYHFGQPGSYPAVYLLGAVPAYIMVWLLSIFLYTGYENKVRVTDLLRGVLTGSGIILIIYALLPETFRFSRALIILGTGWAFLTTITVRYLLSRLYPEEFSLEVLRRKKRMVIIGEQEESHRVFEIVAHAQAKPDLIGYIDPQQGPARPGFLGHLGQIGEIVRINRVDELIFCAANLTAQQIIRTMLYFRESGVAFKIAPPESLSVIGSNSLNTSGDLYVLHFNTLSRVISRRKKRLFDFVLALVLLVLTPFWLWVVNHPAGMFRNIFRVLAGMCSWVGYHQSTGGDHPGLPRIKPGILTPVDLYHNMEGLDEDEVNLSYAKDYRVFQDFRIIFKAFRQLGRNQAPVTYTE
jgi:GT2 family glycosyltransferase